MGTTAEKLAYLNDTKTAIKDAIVSKGVEVPEGTTFREYADLIQAISSGEGKYIWEKYEVNLASGGVDENTLLLLHGEDLTDSSIYGVPITNNGVTVSDAQSKFGVKSLYFNGTAQLSYPMGALNLNNDWTLEWWEYAETGMDLNSAVYRMFNPSNATYGFVTHSVHGGSIRVFAGNTTGNTTWGIIAPTDIGEYLSGKWIHRAVCKSGNTIFGFQNGKLYSTVEMSGELVMSDTMTIGLRVAGQPGFKGWLDELRTSNVARWTSDFTPPSEPYGFVFVGYVVSDEPNKYPDGEEVNGYLYKRVESGLSDADLALATATPEDVKTGKTFYARNKELKTGTASKASKGFVLTQEFVGMIKNGESKTFTTNSKNAILFGAYNKGTAWYNFYIYIKNARIISRFYFDDFDFSFLESGSGLNITFTCTANFLSFTTAKPIYTNTSTPLYIFEG